MNAIIPIPLPVTDVKAIQQTTKLGINIGTLSASANLHWNAKERHWQSDTNKFYYDAIEKYKKILEALKNKNIKMNIKEFITFMNSDYLNNFDIDKNTKQKLKQLEFFTTDNVNKKMSSSELSKVFSIDKNLIDDLLKFYKTQNPASNLSIEEFINITLQINEEMPGLLTTDTINNLNLLKNYTNEELMNFIKVNGITCPDCGSTEFTDIRKFGLMFKTHMGVLEDDSAVVYLRPETAQGIFVNFKNVQRTTRKKVPFGIGQIGKAFRNEITPGNFIFRTREFEQMELEFFCKPDTDLEWFDYWRSYCKNFLLTIGLKEENLKLRDHDPKELAYRVLIPIWMG